MRHISQEAVKRNGRCCAQRVNMDFSIWRRIIFPLVVALGFFLTAGAITHINPDKVQEVERIQKEHFIHESDFNGSFLNFVPKALRWELAMILSFELRLSDIDAKCLTNIQQVIGVDNLNTKVLKRNLTSLIGQSPFHENLTTLDLSGNQIQQIDESAFVGLKKLVRLHLEENQISHLALSIFAPLCNLKHLRLQSNNLKAVEKLWFPANSSVEELFLSKNRITHLSGGCFENLSNMNNLHLAENHLQTLHEESFRGLISLKYLILRRNAIKSFPLDIFSGLIQLSHLELQENLIEFIDPNTFRKNENFSSLDLRKNRLTTLHPNTLEHLMSFRQLDLSENQLVEYNFSGIHAQMIRLTDNHLTELQLNSNATHVKAENNHIDRILVPTTVELYDLQVGDNKIRDLNNITTISTLQALYLSNNGITSLPGNFHKLTRLTLLDLSHNHLTDLSFSSWMENFTISSLSELRINGNNFSRLQPNFLDFFPNLMYLDLCENPFNDNFLLEFTAQCEIRNITLNGSNCKK